MIVRSAGMNALFETGLPARLPRQCKERYREDRHAFRHAISARPHPARRRFQARRHGMIVRNHPASGPSGRKAARHGIARAS
ncbi:MAG: hypothetical protein OD918_07045 [Gammaproteobacteria bacterium]